MIPTLLKRFLIASSIIPIALGAAVTVPKNTSEKPCGQECPFWGMEDIHHFFNRPFPRAGAASTMTETEKAYLISIDLPGMDKKDIKIEAAGNRITVSGERNEESENKEGTKRTFAQFQQSYLLPDDADMEKISAASTNGVLKITVPKTGKKVSKKIEVK